MLDDYVSPLGSILTDLDSLDIDIEDMSEDEGAAYRKQLGILVARTKTLLSQTAKPKKHVDASLVLEYIKAILLNAEEGIYTKLSDYSSFRDIQHTSIYADLIKSAVEASYFGSKVFNVKHLTYQRNAIAKCRTLHDLRQECKAIIEPLGYYRTQEDTKDTVAWLTQEVETLYADVQEKNRMLESITSIYEDSYTDLQLARNIIKAKETLFLTDVEVLDVFNISKRKLSTLRANYSSQESTEVQ